MVQIAIKIAPSIPRPTHGPPHHLPPSGGEPLAVNQALWQRLTVSTRQDAAIVLVSSLSVPVCRFAGA
jgi:hypothetical protein